MSSTLRARDAHRSWTDAIMARLARVRMNIAVWWRGGGRVSTVPNAPARAGPRILLVEDCAVNQLIASAMLERQGVTPMLAANGAEAVVLARGDDFDLILMDLHMPVLGGLEATRQIRCDELERSRPRTPVVAFTSSHLGQDQSALQAFGIDAVLHKPCSEQSLDACLRRWCRPAPGASS